MQLTKNGTLIVLKKDIEKFPKIGSGYEGVVRNYQNKYALKFFYSDYFYDKVNKFKKIEEFTHFKDPSFAFPLGIIEVKRFSISMSSDESGYYSPLIQYNPNYKDFEELYKKTRNQSNQDVVSYLIEASNAMKRIHKLGIIIGDVRGCNIMINEENHPVFVDTDNYAYNTYKFDVGAFGYNMLRSYYGNNFSLKDADIFAYTILALNILITNIQMNYLFINKYIKLMNVPKEAKEILKAIFSNSKNKPYIDEFLSLINPSEQIFDGKAIKRLEMK